MILLTMTSPVRAQMTTVSQKVPLDETSAWRTGLRVCAAAATMGAEPRPDSLEKSPRAIPKRAAIITVVPTKPPPAAWGLKADSTINLMAGHTYWMFIPRITRQPMT